MYRLCLSALFSSLYFLFRFVSVLFFAQIHFVLSRVIFFVIIIIM